MTEAKLHRKKKTQRYFSVSSSLLIYVPQVHGFVPLFSIYNAEFLRPESHWQGGSGE